MPTDIVSDQNGDRECSSRWFHQEAQTFYIDLIPHCLACHEENMPPIE